MQVFALLHDADALQFSITTAVLFALWTVLCLATGWMVGRRAGRAQGSDSIRR